MRVSKNTFAVLALLTLVATYLLVVLGSTVRVTESGMGCAGWPLCSGRIGPIDRFHPLLEQSHRYLAAAVTALIVVLAVGSRSLKLEAPELARLALTGVGFIIIQIVLGAITVFTNNAPITVAAHLVVALCFLGIISVLAVSAHRRKVSPASYSSGHDRLAFAALVGIFLVLIAGSLVVDGGAQAACASWPLCPSSHSSADLTSLQLIHRIVVLVGGAIAATYFVAVTQRKCSSSGQIRLAVIGLALLLTEIVVGAAVAILRAPDVLADVHLAIAAALWVDLVATVTLGYYVFEAPVTLPRSEETNLRN